MNNIENFNMGDSAEANLIMNHNVEIKKGMSTRYEFECFDKHGNLKWKDGFDNLVVDEGLNDVLDKYFKGSTYTATHYVGLKGAGTVAAGDTMASHAGWAEVTAYSEAARQTYTTGSVASQSVDNSASKASFSINGTATVAGAFLSTDNTKGGTTGILYGAGDFAASRDVVDGDTLNVTVTATSAAA